MYSVVYVTPALLIKFLLPGSPCLLVRPGHWYVVLHICSSLWDLLIHKC